MSFAYKEKHMVSKRRIFVYNICIISIRDSVFGQGSQLSDQKNLSPTYIEYFFATCGMQV